MARRRMTKGARTFQIGFRIAMLIIAAVAVFVGIYMCIDNALKKEINLSDYVHLSIEGFNKEGVIQATVDVEEGKAAFFNSIDVSFSKSTNLTNGDEIEIVYTYDKKMAKLYRLKVKGDVQQFAVEGLIDPTVVSIEDLFDGVEVSIEGASPLVTATVNCSSSKYGDAVAYEIVGDKEYYALGESVKVRAVFEEQQLEEMNYVAKIPSEECIKEFPVENVARYITKTDEVTTSMISEMQNKAVTLFTDANEYGMRIFCDAGLMPVYINKKTTFKWSSPSFISAYLNTLKEESYGRTGAKVNDIKLCYESVISQADGTACKAEVIVQFTDLMINEDGTIDLKLDSAEIISADRRDSHIKALINNKLDKDYVSEKIY